MAAIVLAVLLGLFAVWRFVIPSLQGDTASTRAEALLKASDYDSAIAELEAALQAGESPKVLAQLIQAYALKGNANGTEKAMYAKAYPLAKQATDKYPDDIEVLLAVGYLAETAGYYQEASQYYIKASSIDPDNAQILFHIAHTLEFVSENSAASQALYEKAYKLDPENPLVLLAMGSVLSQQGTAESIQSAYAFFMAAAERSDQNGVKAEAWTNAASISLANGDVDDARNLAAWAVNTDRGYAPGLVLYGFVLSYEGKMDEAMGYVTEAMQKNPRYSNAYYVAGLILRAGGNYDQSITHLKNGLAKVDADNTIVGDSKRVQTRARFQYDIAKTYDMAGDTEKSFSALTAAVAIDASAGSRARLDAEDNGFFSELATQERFTSLVSE